MTTGRNTARRDRHRKLVSRGRPPCHICGGEIDYEAPSHLDAMAYTIDHIKPLALGGTDTLDNLAACHRRCNLSKNDTRNRNARGITPPTATGVTFITERQW